MTVKMRLPEILQHHQAVLVTDWLRRQQDILGHRAGSERDERATAEQFLKALGEASRTGNVTDPDQAEWSGVREVLSDISRDRARQGYSSVETATFVF
jgi:rsbT co-antagonist protein RsbR